MTNETISSVDRWTAERARQWYEKRMNIRGFNYLPRTAVNSVEMWQPESFDQVTVDQELSWASAAGFNSARVFLPYVVWEADPGDFKVRLDQFLSIAKNHAISVMPILFDDCAFSGKEPVLGKQDDPVAEVHNSGWVGSPGKLRALDIGYRPRLKDYVEDVVSSFASDPRIVVWDLYNEPGNSGLGDESFSLLQDVFAWARAVAPTQPLTAGPWLHQEGNRLNDFMLEHSDVISFHAYEDAFKTGLLIGRLRRLERPLLCTEWLHRINDNTYDRILPLFAASNTGWYQWGLVKGRTQTYLPWKQNQEKAPAGVWQHDVFHADGSLYDPDEFELLRNFADGSDR
jgi:hypothetical protein